MGIKGKGVAMKLNRKGKVFFVLTLVLSVFAIVGAVALFMPWDELSGPKEDVTVEAGTPITLEIFFDSVPDNAVFLTDVSGIDKNVPAIYQLKIGYGSKEADVILRIEDHTGPTGEVIPMTVYSNWKMPEAKECIANLFDLSGVAKIFYTEGDPKFSAGGDYTVSVSATDTYGNTTVFTVPFKIIDDHTPPVITGAKDLVLEGNPDTLNFFAGVTVKDDYDPEPTLKVDDSMVNYTKSGTYDLIYKAVDKAGNIGTAKVKLTVKIEGEEPEENNNSNTTADSNSYYVGDVTRMHSQRRSFQACVRAAMLRLQELSSTGFTTHCGSDSSPALRTMRMPHTEDSQSTAVTAMFITHAARCSSMRQASPT